MLRNKSNPLSYTMTNSSKNNGGQDKPLGQFFLSKLYLFHSIFSLIYWIVKLYDLMKEFASLTMVAMEISKRQSQQWLLRQKYSSSEAWTFYIETVHKNI